MYFSSWAHPHPLAEEGGGGKVILIKRGGYKDMDACVMYTTSSSLPYLSSCSPQVSSRTRPLWFSRDRTIARLPIDPGRVLRSQVCVFDYNGLPSERAHQKSSAHASAAPWEAVNALDAAFLAYSNVSVLRQQMKPDHRVHGIVEGKNWAPNSTLAIPLGWSFSCSPISFQSSLTTHQ